MRDFRKHTGWYLSGYPVVSEIRRRLALVKSVAEVDDILAAMLDRIGADATIVEGGERIKRGHTNGPIKVAIPDGWLDDQTRVDLATDSTVPDDSEVMALSGG